MGHGLVRPAISYVMHDTLRLGALPVLAALACGESAPPGPGPTADTVAPAVVTLSPAPGDTGVSLRARVEVTFSEPINAATLGPASFFLLKDLAPVPVSYLLDGATVALLPNSELDSVTVYSVTLTGAVRDSTGNRLPGDTSWAFRTGALALRAPRPAGSCGPPACAPR
jgi:hypothetical protein